jgi:hypothetical protein
MAISPEKTPPPGDIKWENILLRVLPDMGATIEGTAGCPGQTILRAQSTTEKPTCIPAVIAISNITRSKTDFHHSGCRWSASAAISAASPHWVRSMSPVGNKWSGGRVVKRRDVSSYANIFPGPAQWRDLRTENVFRPIEPLWRGL